jgi:DNA-binding MarR family transcriptional regulator
LIVLEKKGYIEKKPDETDKRIIHVQLLPLGSAILKKARRSEFFNKATTLLKKKSTISGYSDIFLETLKALQKSSTPQTFKATENNKINGIKKTAIFDLIKRMAVLIRSEERKKCTKLKLQLVHFQVLEYLSLCNKYSDTSAAIANYLGITRGTVSQSIMILEKKNLLKKNQDNVDNRVFHLTLLPNGLSTLQKAKPIVLFKKASIILKKNTNMIRVEEIFIETLTALQKVNNSHSFGVCQTCKNFTRQPTYFFCELTQEKLTKNDSYKICQEHIPI